MDGHPEKTPIDGKDSRLRSFRLRQPPRAATQRQPRQRKHRPFRGVPPPFFLCGGLLGNRSRRRYRLLCAGVCWPPRRVGGAAGAGALSCAAAVGAAQPVSPPPLSPLARSADFASAQEKAPARQQEQRVSGDFPKKQKHRKSLWSPVAAVAGCFARASVWSPSQPAGQGLPLVPALASAGARAPCIDIPVDNGRTTAYQVSV